MQGAGLVETLGVQLFCYVGRADIVGATARSILEALVHGERDTKALAALGQRRLRAEPEVIEEAVRRIFTDHHAFLLKQLLSQVDFLTTRITE